MSKVTAKEIIRMGKTYPINLNIKEMEALACDYLLKGCASTQHHDDTLIARSKIIRQLRKINAKDKNGGSDVS